MALLIKGAAWQPEALSRTYEVICAPCGLPIPGCIVPGSQSQGRHGIFLRAFGLMREYCSKLVGLMVTMLLGVGLDMLPPLLTRKLVDRVLVPHKEVQLLPFILGGLMPASPGRNI